MIVTDTCTWSGTSDGAASDTTTLPVVSSGQNGPGTADSSTTVFDAYGNAEWTRDGSGFLTYTQFDPATGAVLKTIDDVNTSLAGDFSDLPSGGGRPPGTPCPHHLSGHPPLRPNGQPQVGRDGRRPRGIDLEANHVRKTWLNVAPRLADTIGAVAQAKEEAWHNATPTL